MPLAIVHSERDGIEIVSLAGQLTFGQEDLDFRRELDRLIEAGKTNAVFNLSGLSELDCDGLGTLLMVLDRLRTAGGKGAIFTANPSHIELIVEAKLETATEVFATEEDALESFFPDEKIRSYDVLDFVQTYQRNRPKPQAV